MLLQAELKSFLAVFFHENVRKVGGKSKNHPSNDAELKNIVRLLQKYSNEGRILALA